MAARRKLSFFTLCESPECGVASDGEEQDDPEGCRERDVGDAVPALEARLRHGKVEQEGVVVAHEG